MNSPNFNCELTICYNLIPKDIYLVWDKYVLQNLHFKLEGTKELRLKNAITLYDEIIQFYRNFLQTDEALRAIKIFDQILSDYTWITPTKKIDLILWQARDKF